ncbi:MAG: peptide chain release factor 2 [Psittacicella sp.]
MLEASFLKQQILDLISRVDSLREFLEIDIKIESLKEIEYELSSSENWSNQEKMSSLNKSAISLKSEIELIERLSLELKDNLELLLLGEEDFNILEEIDKSLLFIVKEVEASELNKIFSKKFDKSNCYLDIQSGSGGTEAQDWADMVFRMYSRFCDSMDFKVEVIDFSAGDVVGIKGATLKISGDYAYGWLRTETGVHRLVRKSPFDANNKRHTSFCSIFVYPEIDEVIEIDINPADLRIDVYRASGAGGQHINKTESAVRITHLPTNTVVQCQNERSQHKNKAQAMKQLQAKLYELELSKQNEEKQVIEDNKSDIGWGSQIRSYVLDDSRIKDTRTGFEDRNPQNILNGNLTQFIEASLKMGL